MSLSRRDFVIGAAVVGVGLGARRLVAQTTPPVGSAPLSKPAGEVELHWIDGKPPLHSTGATWGVSWPRGQVIKDQPLSLMNQDGKAIAVQTWPLAYWPDGSLKWTAHAAGPEVVAHTALRLTPGKPADGKALTVEETPTTVIVNTGPIRCTIPRTGEHLIETIERDGKPTLSGARLVVLRQDAPNTPETGEMHREAFTSSISNVVVEQKGPIRAVVRLEGKHAGGDRQWLPFTIRLYFYAGSDAVRVMHTFIFDGDEHKDFIRGIGVRFDVAMHDEPHDRHIRFAGQEKGLWAEAVKNFSGLRRDAGKEFIAKQFAGEACPPANTLPTAVRDRLHLIPTWDGFSLYQSSADAFTIRKRTGGKDVSWITADHGARAAGLGYIGSPSGGAAFGLRDFWQRHPTELSVTGATTDSATVTLWLWSPAAEPMDLRFYHDGMGMKTHPEEYEGLEITYEDYEAGFGTPVGIARSSELMIWALPATPTRQRLVEMADAMQHPPLLAAAPEHHLQSEVFGPNMWALPDRSTPAKTKIENTLDWHFDFYKNQVEQRHWYGFWNYGDVMHTYDPNRHVWRYDVGGFAWDNSELSPDLWLWYSYLRTGRADIFRFAEAMTRHTGEVDVYHLGRFKNLGTRHGVMHWGDSAKQLRISTAIYRRFYYYLSGGDERVGDLLHELVDADQTFINLDPIRKIRKEPYKPEPHALSVGFGTDWGSLAAAWLAEWERTGDTKYRDKIANGMKTIAAMPHGFYTGSAALDPDTGLFTNRLGDEVNISHLSAVFGLPEVCAELIQLIDVPEFEKAWLDYCEFYNVDARTREAALGFNFKTQPLTAPHSRLTAYAAVKRKSPALAKRAWDEFFSEEKKWSPRKYENKTDRIEGPDVLTPIDEAAWVSTNSTAQWGLSAIQCLALIPDTLAIDF